MSREKGYWEVGDKVIMRQSRDWAWNKGQIAIINRIYPDYEGKKLPENMYQLLGLKLLDKDGSALSGTFCADPKDFRRYKEDFNKVLWRIEDIEKSAKTRFKIPENAIVNWNKDGVTFTF